MEFFSVAQSSEKFIGQIFTTCVVNDVSESQTIGL